MTVNVNSLFSAYSFKHRVNDNKYSSSTNTGTLYKKCEKETVKTYPVCELQAFNKQKDRADHLLYYPSLFKKGFIYDYTMGLLIIENTIWRSPNYSIAPHWLVQWVFQWATASNHGNQSKSNIYKVLGRWNPTCSEQRLALRQTDLPT